MKVGRIVLAILILIIIIVGIILIVKKTNVITLKMTGYLASDISTVTLYTYDKENNSLQESKNVARGIEVTKYGDSITQNDIKYINIEYDKNKYYIKEDNLVNNKEDVVLEKNRFVRTSVTVYENEKDSRLVSFIKNVN